LENSKGICFNPSPALWLWSASASSPSNCYKRDFGTHPGNFERHAGCNDNLPIKKVWVPSLNFLTKRIITFSLLIADAGKQTLVPLPLRTLTHFKQLAQEKIQKQDLKR
jgi:hypothetical protein